MLLTKELIMKKDKDEDKDKLPSILYEEIINTEE